MSITKNEIKRIKSLHTKKGRQENRQFIAEGVRLLEEALFFKSFPETIYYSPAVLGDRGKALIDKFSKHRIQILEISARDLDALSETSTSQGIIGVFSLKSQNIEQLYHTDIRNILWCENISDPGNLGTLVRSALAFDFDLIILSGDSTDIYAPKTVRSSAGALFGASVAFHTVEEVFRFAVENEFKIAAAELNGERIDYLLKNSIKNTKLIVAIGAEAYGLSESIITKADYKMRIEHTEKVESLNAAIAGSIIMSKIYSYYQGNKHV